MKQLRNIGAMALSFVCLGSAHAATKPEATPTQVKLFFIEALDPKDTTSSQRFQQEYELAISKGKEFTSSQLKNCGFELTSTTYFYGASDPIQAKEQAERATKEGAWLLIGPRRSNHYLILAKGAPEIPSISLMASSDEIGELGNIHLTLSPANSEMAKAAAEEAAGRIPKDQSKTYVAVVSSDCLACKNFEKHFDKIASAIGLKKAASLSVVGDQPDVTKLSEELKRSHPAFILLPNYSIVTTHLISAIHSMLPNAFFVGGDGWGDPQFGFVQNGLEVGDAEGFTVRGFPPMRAGLSTFKLGKNLMISPQFSNLESSSALGILSIFNQTAELLCKTKPKTNAEFVKAFQKHGPRLFSPPWGTSIYNLERRNIVFLKSSGVGR
jgi:formaldehyde-activating enzyme involved in methanogenesis